MVLYCTVPVSYYTVTQVVIWKYSIISYYTEYGSKSDGSRYNVYFLLIPPMYTAKTYLLTNYILEELSFPRAGRAALGSSVPPSSFPFTNTLFANLSTINRVLSN